jgi:hypothetical protein
MPFFPSAVAAPGEERGEKEEQKPREEEDDTMPRSLTRPAPRTMTPMPPLTLHGPDPPALAHHHAENPASEPSVSAAAALSLLSPAAGEVPCTADVPSVVDP